MNTISKFIGVLVIVTIALCLVMIPLNFMLAMSTVSIGSTAASSGLTTETLANAATGTRLGGGVLAMGCCLLLVVLGGTSSRQPVRHHSDYEA